MNERPSDFALLQEFMRERRQPAFAILVRRHLDLVYATALRKVEDSGGAEEIAQNVFSALARKAWQFARDDSVPAWLHKTALLESKFWLRGEMRRRRREQTAAELGTTMNTQDNASAFHALVPLLDDALLSLRDKDRTALLLRYYERHSLAEVGAAFGVNEKTAQKRVQSALEKLAGFFKRHGYKSATVTAAAAVLQHTATSASASVVGAVVSGALQVAPPALVGLGALVARMVSLSRVQTAAMCVALVAVPLGWQLNERHAAAEELKRSRAQLIAAQKQGAAAQQELDRLRAGSGRLAQSVAQAIEMAAAAAESERTFDAWKKKTRGLLTAADYRWSDESPFARIPKSALAELARLSDAEPFATPGIVKPYARELMGLSPAERQSLEEILHQHFLDVEGRRAALIYETNQPSRQLFGTNVLAGKVFITPGLGDQAKELVDHAVEELRGLVGEERWPLVATRLKRSNSFLESILTSGFSWPSEVQVTVQAGEKELQFAFLVNGGPVIGGESYPLSIFLPDGDPGSTERAARACDWLSQPLRQRMMAWAQEQAITRLRKKEKP